MYHSSFVLLNLILNKERIILGIDPGTTIMGYGIIAQSGNKISLLVMDVVKLDKLPNQALKLKKIFETCLDLIEKYKPDALAIEAPFFGKNVQSMLKLRAGSGSCDGCRLVSFGSYI